MSPDEAVQFIRRNVVPMMTERQITEFYMHAGSLDRMRLEHQLEALRERNEGTDNPVKFGHKRAPSGRGDSWVKRWTKTELKGGVTQQSSAGKRIALYHKRNDTK